MPLSSHIRSFRYATTHLLLLFITIRYRVRDRCNRLRPTAAALRHVPRDRTHTRAHTIPEYIKMIILLLLFYYNNNKIMMRAPKTRAPLARSGVYVGTHRSSSGSRGLFTALCVNAAENRCPGEPGCKH